MNPNNQILATIYENNEKVCSMYFQALPRVGEKVIVSDYFESTYEVREVQHTSYPVASTSANSYNLNQPRLSEISLLCVKRS